MTGIYVAGEVNSIAQGQYSERAVLEVKLIVDGIYRTIRAPANCRSFVHPTGGMRVTRQDIDVFEFPTNSVERLFFHIPYSCGLTDARISFASSTYVTVYSIAEKPELSITERRAIPTEEDTSKNSTVVLMARRVDTDTYATNANSSGDLIRGLQSGMSADQQYLQSISTFELPVKLEDLPSVVRDRLATLNEPIFVDEESRKLLVPLFRQLPSSFQNYPADLGHWQRQVPAVFSAERKEFNVDLLSATRGKRVYYLVPKIRDCGLINAPCRTYEYSFRIGRMVSEFPRPIYGPARRSFLVPVNMGVTYRTRASDRTVAPNPTAETDARKTGARGSP